MIETLERQQTPVETVLRRERAELPGKIKRASWRVQDLRGEGHRPGDPELEEALQAVRELADRERALPDLICDAVAERCAAEAAALREQERGLIREAEESQREAAKAQEAAERAQRKAREARTRVEGYEIRRDALRMEAMPRDDFVRQAGELEGEKRLRLLEDARANGLMLPFSEATDV